MHLLLGRRIRPLRIKAGLTQAALAERLGISASYLNLVENDKRPVTSTLLLGLARTLDVDVRVLAADADTDLVARLTEILCEPLFEEHPVMATDVRDFASGSPEVAHAMIALHDAYRRARTALETLSAQVLDEQHDLGAVDRARLSSERVSDFIQRHNNYFPALESAAQDLLTAGEIGVGDDELFTRLSRHLLQTHGVRVRICTVGAMRGAVRRFVPARREVQLSETQRGGSRNLQLAAQIGLLQCADTLDALTDDPRLASDESRALGRVALANYFAAAVLMPYDTFRRAAEDLRYDVELLGDRFRVRWEQVCHRLTTLRRPGAEGVPFYMLRVDLAGNISKRFSAAGIHFPRFSGLCSLWNVHAAFLQPGRVRVQLSQLPGGHTVLAIARTVQRYSRGYGAPEAPYAVGIGCDVQHAGRVVYGDGLDVQNPALSIPIGVTCRLCERSDCAARAFPSMAGTLRIDPNVRGVSFFAATGEAGE
jgi:predicted transcriptional regulator/transcriptional regulator with XRE-family HTH domain